MRNPPAMDAARLMSSGVRRDIVDALNALPSGPTPDEPNSSADGLPAAELAARLGLHVTTIRFHLDQLVAAGVLECTNERVHAAGRPRKLYRVAPPSRPDGAGTEPYRLLAELLITTITAGGDPSLPDTAGFQWGRRRATSAGVRPEPPARSAGAWLSKVGRLMDQLTDWGYTANVRTTNAGRTAQVFVERCPIADLAQQAPGVLCGLHRGAMRGALDALGETEADVSVNPSIAPGLCMAQLTTRTDFANPMEEA